MIPNMQIRLIPKDFYYRSVIQEYSDIFQHQTIKHIRGAVAYFCIDPANIFGEKISVSFANKISGEEDKAFLCIDISYPTDIDVIKAFYEKHDKKPNIFIHLYKFSSGFKPYLLHSKAFISEYINNQLVSLILGSHNFTQRALMGKNIEASLRIDCSKDDILYSDVETYLQNIRQECFKFESDEESIKYLKALQGKFLSNDTFNLGEPVMILTVFGDIEKLEDKTVLLLGLFADLHKKLRYNSTVYLYAIDEYQNAYLYQSTVLQLGGIDRKIPKTYDMTFTDRIVAFEANAPSYILNNTPRDYDKTDLINFNYFLSLQINRKWSLDSKISGKIRIADYLTPDSFWSKAKEDIKKAKSKEEVIELLNYRNIDLAKEYALSEIANLKSYYNEIVINFYPNDIENLLSRADKTLNYNWGKDRLNRHLKEVKKRLGLNRNDKFNVVNMLRKVYVIFE